MQSRLHLQSFRRQAAQAAISVGGEAHQQAVRRSRRGFSSALLTNFALLRLLKTLERSFLDHQYVAAQLLTWASSAYTSVSVADLLLGRTVRAQQGTDPLGRARVK
jgi:hypothetical protein